MLEGASGGFLTATDVAEYLVMKGVPFREAHRVVGRLVAYCIEKKMVMAILTLAEFRRFHRGFEEDIYTHLKVEQAVHSKKSHGGTSRKNVSLRIKDIRGRKK
jgi:argininosuccinate lyase